MFAHTVPVCWRTEVQLGNNNHFLLNSHLHLIISEVPKSRLIQPLLNGTSFSCVCRKASEGIGSSLLGIEAPGLSAAPERIQFFFFQKKCDFVSSDFLPSVSLGLFWCKVESYSSFGISGSLIFYFAVAEALSPPVWDTVIPVKLVAQGSWEGWTGSYFGLAEQWLHWTSPLRTNICLCLILQ